MAGAPKTTGLGKIGRGGRSGNDEGPDSCVELAADSFPFVNTESQKQNFKNKQTKKKGSKIRKSLGPVFSKTRQKSALF